MVNLQINRLLWENYEEYALQRGHMVSTLLSKYLCLKGAKILDFGAGNGGASLQLARQGAVVSAVEINDDKRAKIQQSAAQNNLSIQVFSRLPEGEIFDAVILLDVIEHLDHWRHWLRYFASCLRPQGLIYLSTPNKWAVLNVFCDPHFSLPIVALLSRRWVKKIVIDWLAWQPRDRRDLPQLLSLKELDRGIRRTGLSWSFINRSVLDYALKNPPSLWNRPIHLQVIRLLQKTRLDRVLVRLISDEKSQFNRFVQPTWYMLLQKRDA